MNDLTRPASRAILDHALADLRTAAGGTGRITTIAAGVTTTWTLDRAEHAVLTAAGYCWRDDRSALILETGRGPRLLMLTPAPAAATLVERLAAAAANIDAYIDRRAAELAQPLIEQARTEADARVLDAQLKTQRAQDLTAELRRQIKALDRQARRAVELEDELRQMRSGMAGTEVPR